jgi:hypothetical protein
MQKLDLGGGFGARTTTVLRSLTERRRWLFEAISEDEDWSTSEVKEAMK